MDFTLYFSSQAKPKDWCNKILSEGKHFRLARTLSCQCVEYTNQQRFVYLFLWSGSEQHNWLHSLHSTVFFKGWLFHQESGEAADSMDNLQKVVSLSRTQTVKENCGWNFINEEDVDFSDLKEKNYRYDIANADHIGGEYLVANVNDDGSGHIYRSQIGTVKLFYNHCCVSTRASLANLIYHNGKMNLSKDFFRSSLTYAICENSHSMFEGIYCLDQNEEIVIDDYQLKIVKSTGDFLFSPQLQELHDNHYDDFWDSLFCYMNKMAKGIISLCDKPMAFPLSGGKDSRLLLALFLYNDPSIIERVYTWGIDTSPEVITAKLIADALSLKHQVRTSALENVDERVYKVGNYIGQHIFINESEVSLFDPSFALEETAWNRRKTNTCQPHGQEVALRNMSDKVYRDAKDLMNWFKGRYPSDRLGILNDSCIAHNSLELEARVSQYLEEDTRGDYQQIATRDRVESRIKRWVSSIWSNYNDIYFAPFLLLDKTVVSYNYSVNSVARSREEFHFEIMRRLNSSLVHIPFSHQTWNEEIYTKTYGSAPPTGIVWSDKRNDIFNGPTKHALLSNYKKIKSRLLQNNTPLFKEIVNVNKLRRYPDIYERYNLEGAAFWNLVTFDLLTRFEGRFDELALYNNDHLPDYQALNILPDDPVVCAVKIHWEQEHRFLHAEVDAVGVVPYLVRFIIYLNGKEIEKTEYQKSLSLKFKVDKPGEYCVRAYVKVPGERRSFEDLSAKMTLDPQKQ